MRPQQELLPKKSMQGFVSDENIFVFSDFTCLKPFGKEHVVFGKVYPDWLVLYNALK